MLKVKVNTVTMYGQCKVKFLVVLYIYIYKITEHHSVTVSTLELWKEFLPQRCFTHGMMTPRQAVTLTTMGNLE